MNNANTINATDRLEMDELAEAVATFIAAQPPLDESSMLSRINVRCPESHYLSHGQILNLIRTR